MTEGVRDDGPGSYCTILCLDVATWGVSIMAVFCATRNQKSVEIPVLPIQPPTP